MGAEVTTSRQRVLARVPSPLDLAPSQGRIQQTPVVEHHGVSRVPLRRIIVPGGMFSFAPPTDAAMIIGVSNFLALRGMSRDTRTYCLPI